MKNMNYVKRKNQSLQLKIQEALDLAEIQNFCPLYEEFFVLNATNNDKVNFRHKFYIHDILEFKEGLAIIKDETVEETFVEKKIFFKQAPLLDPFRMLIGKYRATRNDVLPKFNTIIENMNCKLKNSQNCSYVEMLFVTLNTLLLENYGCQNCIEFYGTFTAIKNNFEIDVSEDIDYLKNCRYFYKDLITNPKFCATILDMPNVYELNTKRYEVQWLKYMESLNLQSYHTIISHGSSSEALMRYLESFNLAASPSKVKKIIFIDAPDIYTAGERHGRRFLFNRITNNCKTVDVTFLVAQNNLKISNETNNLINEFLNYDHKLATYTPQDNITSTLLSYCK